MKRCPKCNTLSADHANQCEKCNHDLSQVKSLTPTVIEKQANRVTLLPILGGIILFCGVVLLIYSIIKGLNVVVPIFITLVGVIILEVEERLSKIEEMLKSIQSKKA